MARLASTDLTVTVLDRGIVGKKRRSYGSIVFDSTSLTYTIATGILMPTAPSFGFLSLVDNMFFVKSLGAGATELVFKYDKTNHSIRVYRSAGFTPAGTVAAPVFTGIAVTPAGTVSAPVFTGDNITEVAVTGTSHSVTGTISQPVFAGIALTPSGTVSAPAFTGTAVAATALAEFTDNTALGGAVTLYFDAIGV